MTEKCYSLNDEEYRYRDLGELFDAMESDGLLEVGQVYYEMACETVSAEDFFNVDLILDSAGDQAYDQLGECSEDMFAVSKEAIEELDGLLTAWARKHVTGTWWRCIGKSIEHRVTADDISAGGD